MAAPRSWRATPGSTATASTGQLPLDGRELGHVVEAHRHRLHGDPGQGLPPPPPRAGHRLDGASGERGEELEGEELEGEELEGAEHATAGRHVPAEHGGAEELAPPRARPPPPAATSRATTARSW
jgi:hypothetical protein